MRQRRWCGLVVMVLGWLGGLAAAPAETDWGSCELVFTGKLIGVVAGPVGRSMPPVYSHRLTFTVDQVLRGPLATGSQVTLAHVARQETEPTFPQGQVCLVGGGSGFGGRAATSVVKAEPALVAAASAACALPLGWKLVDGRPVSPWAPLGRGAWPAVGGTLGATTVCSASGRPALLCGRGLTLKLEQLPPAKAIQWTNPDGDGPCRLSLTNTTDKPVSVPALLTDGQAILWANSVVVLCGGQSYYLPGYRAAPAKLEAVTLAPHQTIAGEVNPLALEGPEWPRGGYRIKFQLCLGELSVADDFYYMSNHHDRLRAKLAKVKPGEILYDELKAVILAGTVRQAAQTHARAVEVAMADGRTYRATEPGIDDLIHFLREHAKPVPPIATE